MTFTLPDTFQKELAKSSQAIYKSKLNALAREGFDSVDMLKTKSKGVIEAIKKITGEDDTEAVRYNRRVILSAIFWVTKLPAKNAYHTFWQKCTPKKVSGTDDPWKTAKKFNKDKKDS
jgi:hypothetical protein